MTNPPRNPAVRKLVLEDLQRYGIRLEPATWPPKAPRVCKPQSPRGQIMKWAKYDNGAVALDPKRLNTSVSDSALSPRRMNSIQGGKKSERGDGRGRRSLFRETDDDDRCRGRKGKKSMMFSDDDDLASVAAEPPPPQGDESPDSWAQHRQLERVVSDTELQNSIESLRTQGRMHRAATSDKERFAADFASTGSMVLAGAGSTPNSPGTWASDSSYLTRFHNSAIRTVDPSRIKVLKTPVKPRRRRVDLEGNGVEASDIKPCHKYAPDPAVCTLRQLRQALCPEEPEKKVVAAKPVQLARDRQLEVARALRERLGF